MSDPMLHIPNIWVWAAMLVYLLSPALWVAYSWRYGEDTIKEPWATIACMVTLTSFAGYVVVINFVMWVAVIAYPFV